MNDKQAEQMLTMIENMSEAMVKMQAVIGDVVRSNVELRSRVNELEKRSSSKS